jgi:hypothetical protein
MANANKVPHLAKYEGHSSPEPFALEVIDQKEECVSRRQQNLIFRAIAAEDARVILGINDVTPYRTSNRVISPTSMPRSSLPSITMTSMPWCRRGSTQLATNSPGRPLGEQGEHYKTAESIP